MSQIKTQVLFSAKIADGLSDVLEPWGTRRTVHTFIAGDGAVSADVLVQVSNNGTSFVELNKIELSGTDTDAKIYAFDSAYRYVRLELDDISGTGAAVTAIFGSHNG